MKLLIPAGLLALMVSPLAAGQPVGLASATESFRVTRGEAHLTGRPATPFLVSPGDLLHPGASPLRLEGTGGETVLVGRDSTLQLEQPLHYRLLEGRMAVALPAGGGDGARLEASDLEFRRIGAYEAGDVAAVHQVALGTNPNGSEIAVFSDGGMLSVHSLLSGDQIAIVGPGEIARFIRDALGQWTFVSPTMQETERETEGIGESDGEEGVIGLFESAFGGGGAGAAAGAAALVVGGAIIGYGVVEASSDDGNGGDSPSTTSAPRGPATRIIPPDQPEEPIVDEPPGEEFF